MTSETTPPAATTTEQVTTPVILDNATQNTVTSPVVAKADAAPAAVDPAAPVAAIVTDSAKPADGQTTQQDWAIKRINEITAKRYEAERAAEAERKGRIAAEDEARKTKELLAQIGKNSAPGASPDPATPPAKPAMSEDDIQKMIEERAELKAQATAFNKTCDAVAETGKKEFKDWDTTLGNLRLVGALGKDVPPLFLETVVELKDPHKILHHLGSNMDEAARITKLPPTKMAMEMARLEAQLSAPPVVVAPPISNAPPPVNPITGATKVSPGSLDDPNLSSEEWYKLREEQALAKKRRYLRVP